MVPEASLSSRSSARPFAGAGTRFGWKPRGLPYDDFYRGIPSLALEAGGGLWERRKWSRPRRGVSSSREEIKIHARLKLASSQ